jgi:hypothetical protein
MRRSSCRTITTLLALEFRVENELLKAELALPPHAAPSVGVPGASAPLVDAQTVIVCLIIEKREHLRK